MSSETLRLLAVHALKTLKRKIGRRFLANPLVCSTMLHAGIRKRLNIWMGIVFDVHSFQLTLSVRDSRLSPCGSPWFDNGVHIDFAYKTFVWDSQASDKANVHVVIVGFSKSPDMQPLLFSSTGATKADNINGYLSNAPDVFVEKRRQPLCSVPKMSRGGGAGDWGFLTLDEAEAHRLLTSYPALEQYIRPFSMGSEFIKGINRYCLWFAGLSGVELSKLPKEIRDRFDEIRKLRLASPRSGTQKRACAPWEFDEVKAPADGAFLAVPQVSSGRRKYIPVGFITNGTIPGNKLFFVEEADLYDFGIISSQFHNAWMRQVAGRLKSDYSILEHYRL